MSQYGIPYMGSKAKIAKEICSRLPSNENFYDLFGGGFSITHCMLLHRPKDFKSFHFNEIRSGIPKLIQDAIAGLYSYEKFLPPWVSREDFLAKKESDPYIKIIWSFGNNGEGYLFGKDIEAQKKSMHMAVIFNEFDSFAKEFLGMEKFKEGYSVYDKRLFIKRRIEFFKSNKRMDMQQLERLERLERLEQLEQLERLHFYNSSYEDVDIKPNSTIYCDIPYIGTADYGNRFDHKKFYDWADSQKEPVFISEYRLDDDRFKCVFNIKKTQLLTAKDSRTKALEKLFVNKAGYERLMRRSNGSA